MPSWPLGQKGVLFVWPQNFVEDEKQQVRARTVYQPGALSPVDKQ